jgi:hypothetical protein
LHFAVEWAQDNLAITPKSTLMPLPLTQAERKQRKAERVAREKKMVQHLRARVLASITFDEIKGAALKLPDTQRAELVALLACSRAGSN